MHTLNQLTSDLNVTQLGAAFLAFSFLFGALGHVVYFFSKDLDLATLPKEQAKGRLWGPIRWEWLIGRGIVAVVLAFMLSLLLLEAVQEKKMSIWVGYFMQFMTGFAVLTVLERFVVLFRFLLKKVGL